MTQLTPRRPIARRLHEPLFHKLALSALGSLVALVFCTVGIAPAQGQMLHDPQRRAPPAGHLQPVDVIAPAGTLIGVATDVGFLPAHKAPRLVGLPIGGNYRLEVRDFPHADGRVVYPTIQMLDCLHPPAGRELEFPIPVELTQEDLLLAAQGHFITRVIYVENPQAALPTQDDPAHPRWIDAGPGGDPMFEAMRVGRPVAILRIGGRVPDFSQGVDEEFLRSSAGAVELQRPMPSRLAEPTKAALLKPADATAPAQLPQPRSVRSRYSPGEMRR